MGLGLGLGLDVEVGDLVREGIPRDGGCSGEARPKGMGLSLRVVRSGLEMSRVERTGVTLREGTEAAAAAAAAAAATAAAAVAAAAARVAVAVAKEARACLWPSKTS